MNDGSGKGCSLRLCHGAVEEEVVIYRGRDVLDLVQLCKAGEDGNWMFRCGRPGGFRADY